MTNPFTVNGMDIFPESFQKKQNNNEAGVHPKSPDENESNPLSLSMQTTGDSNRCRIG